MKSSSSGWAEDKTGTPGLDGDTDERGTWKKGGHKRGWKGAKMQKKRSVLPDELDEDVSPDYVPSKRRSDSRILRKATGPSTVYTQPDQNVRGSGPSRNLTAHHTETGEELNSVPHRYRTLGQSSRLREMSVKTHTCVSFLQRRRSATSGKGSWTWKVTGTRSTVLVLNINTALNVWEVCFTDPRGRNQHLTT